MDWVPPGGDGFRPDLLSAEEVQNLIVEKEMRELRDSIPAHRHCEACHGHGKVGQRPDYRLCGRCHGSGAEPQRCSPPAPPAPYNRSRRIPRGRTSSVRAGR